MKARVLIVEDDPFIALSLSTLLKSNDFEVLEIIDNAEDAWVFAEQHFPDLILLDIRLVGEKTGIWVGQKIKEKNLTIKYIYLTAFNDNDTIEQITTTDPELYITKPFNKKVLLSNIELILKKSAIIKPLEVYDGKKKHIFNTQEISLFKSDGNYVNIYFKNNKVQVIRIKIKEILSVLDNPDFIRVHQSYVVNTKSVTLMSKNYLYINDNKIPVSAPYRALVTEKLKCKC